MARIVVDVVLSPEILDPQGKAVAQALTRLGLDGVEGVRQGKHFEIDLAGDLDEARRAKLEQLAGELLANPVIESYTLRVEDNS